MSYHKSFRIDRKTLFLPETVTSSPSRTSGPVTLDLQLVEGWQPDRTYWDASLRTFYMTGS